MEGRGSALPVFCHVTSVTKKKKAGAPMRPLPSFSGLGVVVKGGVGDGSGGGGE